jgi:tight adherence protein B
MRRRSVRRRLDTVFGTRRRGPALLRLTRAALTCRDGLAARPRAGRFAAFVIVSSTVGLVEGPVAAIIGGVYAVLAASGWYSRCRRRAAAGELARSVEAVGAFAAELRAGLPVPEAGSSFEALLGNAEAAQRVTAARQISDRLGAPLADLLDQVDEDLRAGQRLRAAVEAETAGAQATGVLLAVLPVAAIAIGSGLGTHPLQQLLHTPLGQACALLGLAAQCAGMVWERRMISAAVAEVT